MANAWRSRGAQALYKEWAISSKNASELELLFDQHPDLANSVAQSLRVLCF